MLADFVIKATALLLVGLVTVGLMRRASAASRHLVLTATLTAVLLLPLARVVLPTVPLAVLPAATSEVMESTVTHPVPVAAAGSTPKIDAVRQPVAVRTTSEAAQVHWAAVFVTTWLIGVVALFLRGVAGLLGLWRITTRSHRADDARLLSDVWRRANELGITRRVTTRIAGDDSMPVTWGIGFPILLLPSNTDAWRDAAPGRLDAVLVHELAHVARFDALAHLVARLACALLWFHPLVWMAARQARLDSERACDDLVLSRGARASSYADELVALSQTLSTPTPDWTIAQAMARRSQVERRVLAILDVRVNRRGLSRVGIALAVLLIFAMLPVAAARILAGSDEMVPRAAGPGRASELPEAPRLVPFTPFAEDLAAIDALVRRETPRSSSSGESQTPQTRAAAQPADVLNVTGTWVIDGDKSTPKNFAAFGDVFTITQDATHLHLDMVEVMQAIHFSSNQSHGQSQSQLGPATSRPVSLTYTLDGSEIDVLPSDVSHHLPANTDAIRIRPVQSASSAKPDGKTLVITTTTTSQTERLFPTPPVTTTMTQTVRYVLLLDASGRLTIERTITVDLGYGLFSDAQRDTSTHGSSSSSVYRRSAGW